jgi:hypothetical protein
MGITTSWKTGPLGNQHHARPEYRHVIRPGRGADDRLMVAQVAGHGERVNARVLPRVIGSIGSWVRLAAQEVEEVRIQGVSVLPTRKPPLPLRLPAVSQLRLAARRSPGTSYQEPPRRTRRLQSPLVQAEPSAGASS